MKCDNDLRLIVHIYIITLIVYCGKRCINQPTTFYFSLFLQSTLCRGPPLLGPTSLTSSREAPPQPLKERGTWIAQHLGLLTPQTSICGESEGIMVCV